MPSQIVSKMKIYGIINSIYHMYFDIIADNLTYIKVNFPFFNVLGYKFICKFRHCGANFPYTEVNECMVWYFICLYLNHLCLT